MSNLKKEYETSILFFWDLRRAVRLTGFGVSKNSGAFVFKD
jgi:hypothetical protein